MTNLPSTADICIVGAGPSGLSLAIALHKAGLKPLLLEKHATPANTSRAAVVHARTLEVFEELDVTPRLLAAGIRVPIFRVRDRDRVLMTADFSGLATSYPFTLMCPQDVTEAILRERLAELGGTIQRGAAVTFVDCHADGATVTVARDDVTQEIAVQWVIGCDGGHSIVREGVGIAFEGQAYEQKFVLADVQMEWPLAHDEVSLFFSPSGLVVVAPLPQDRVRIVATVDEAPQSPDIGFIERLLVERGPTGTSTHVQHLVWSSRFQVAHKLAGQFVKGRAVLCGDAAHVHSPAGGQGMNTGIQDAVTLAKPLLEAFRSGDEGALSAWAANRLAIASDLVSLTDRMTRAATLRSKPGRLLRNAVLTIAGHVPGVPGTIAHKLAELDRR